MQSNPFFPEIKGNFGFGCMRLPSKLGNIDYSEFEKMVDKYLESGFNYFDTAHGYHRGHSETAIRDCVAGRYPRERFILTDKLTDPYFKKKEDIRPFFESQLNDCGVDYFDFYLMHAQDRHNYVKFKKCSAYETAYSFKEEGLIKHFGISFHDRASVLDMILTEHPEIEVVQIQFNYIDYDDPLVESRKVYEICEKHNKPVIVMEPVKGGNLVNLPKDADKLLRALGGGSNASYAVRFAASFPNIAVVISGMSNMEQVNDNTDTMKDFRPLDSAELEAVRKVRAVFRKLSLVPCTGCRYCVDENNCPKDIRIPEMFSSLNIHEAFHDWNTGYYYNTTITGAGHSKASDCIKCGKCEKVCPQHLHIRDLLEKVAETFEK